MRQNSKKKICLIVDCLSKGGAEKVAAFLSKSLYDSGYEVFIISLRDDISYKYKGELLNIGKNEPSIKIIKQLKKLFLFNKYYNKIEADFYIDFRMRNRFIMEFLLHFFVFKNKKMIMSVHSCNIKYHIPKGFIFRRLYHKTKAIIAVSNEIAGELSMYHAFNNIKYIPNFVNENLLLTSKLSPKNIPNNAVLAIGKLNMLVKQFDKLILSYINTNTFKKGIPLIILGDGSDRLVLENLIKSNKLETNIKLLGFVPNPYDYMKHCKFLVLSSKFEGFPMVILETLALGKPVISFNCKSGPAELIEHKENGLLVKDQDFNELGTSIDLLQEDVELYEKCKSNALHSVLKFSERKVMKSWEDIFNN